LIGCKKNCLNLIHFFNFQTNLRSRTALKRRRVMRRKAMRLQKPRLEMRQKSLLREKRSQRPKKTPSRSVIHSIEAKNVFKVAH
jgi:hypothetical protein